MATFKQYSQPLNDASEAFSIESFAATEIKVRVDGVLKTAGTGTGAGASHDYELQSYTVNGGTVAWVADKIPAQNAVIRIYRESAVDPAQATYSAGASVKAGDLNNNQTQALRGIEETQDQLVQNWEIEPNAVHTAQIKDDAVTSAKLDTNIDIAGTLDVTGATTLDSSLNVTGSTTTAALGVDGNFDVNTNKFTVASASGNTTVAGDLSVTGITALTGNVSLEGNIDLKDGDKLFLGNDDDVELQHNGSNTYLTNKTGVFLVRGDDIRVQNESGSDAIVELSTGSGVHVYHGGNKKFETNSGGAKITGALETTGNITGNLIGNVTGDVTGDLGGNADTATKLATARNIGGVAFDGTADITIPGVNSAGNQNTTGTAAGITGVTASVAELNYTDGVTSNIQTQLNAKQALDAELTTLAGMQSGTASILAGSTALTSTTTELNLLDGKSFVTSVSGSSTDVQIPSAKAVNDAIVGISDAGNFVPIANEVSFPNTNPDPGNDAGTIVSIADAGGIVVNGSGVSTTGRTLGGATVTINGIDSSLHSSTIAAGKGMLVQTTSTLNTYDYHRLVVDEAGVAAAQTLVSDFNDRYQVASSTPSQHPDGSALQDGDLWFDTTANTMKVYDLGNTSYSAVTSVGDYKLLTIVNDGQTSGSPTYNGSIVSYDLRDGSSAASITSVGQLLVSLNGVLQKPNAGSWSASNEGFHLEGTNGIKFCTAPPSGSNVFITLIGSATSVNTPATNSIVEAAIQTNVVSEEKLKVSNTPTDGYYLQYKDSTDKLTWAAVSGAPEGTAVKSTGETGTTKFLRIDGDNTCSWQVPPDTNTQLSNAEVRTAVEAATDSNVFTDADHSKLNGIATSANNYVHPNHSGEVTSTADGATVIADDTVDEANLKISNAGSNGQFLSKQSGNTGGLTWADAGGTVADGCIYENAQTISNNYTISTNYNALSAGPITISATLTIPSGSVYTIV